MNILLVNPPMPERTYPGKAMGLDYLAKELIDNNIAADILDLDICGREQLLPIIRENRPQIVGITNLSIQNDMANEIAEEVKTHDNSICIVKGGFHELCGYKTSLEFHHKHIDYVIVGEGEKTFLEFVKSFKKSTLKEDRKNIYGLAFYENGIFFSGRRQPIRIENLNELIPKRLHYDTSYDFDVLEGKKTAQVMSIRGCANACNFCTESRTGSAERKRSIESLFSELNELANDGYEAVYFDDPTFTRDRERVIKVCEMFRNYFPKFVWGCNTRKEC